MSKFGKLELIPFREGWQSEADFDEWLVSDEGLDLLGQALDLGTGDLEVIGRQVPVGPYKADVLLRVGENEEEDKIVIENQRKSTNHDHLGKVITYAANLKARRIVWIAEVFNDEHRAAFDWLNEHLDGEIEFFALEIGLWRIENSAPAPRFNIISEPNEVRQAIKMSSASAEWTESKAFYLNFWRSFKDYLEEKGSRFSNRKATPRYWAGYPTGKAFVAFNLILVSSKKSMRIDVRFRGKRINGHDVLNHIKAAHGEDIRHKLGGNLEWISTGKKWKFGRIALTRENINIRDEERWPEYHAWLMETLHKFDETFRPILADIDPANFPPVQLAEGEDDEDIEEGEDGA